MFYDDRFHACEITKFVNSQKFFLRTLHSSSLLLKHREDVLPAVFTFCQSRRLSMYASLPEAPQEAIKNRPLDLLATDTAAVRAIAQAAVNVELFTIPLYMT